MMQQIQRANDNETLRETKKIEALQRAEALSWERCAQEIYSALIVWPEK